MADHINDGGPAFPRTEREGDQAIYFGASMRDYFAAKAMQGMLAVPDDQQYGDRSDKTLTVEQWQAWCVTGLVEYAYVVADAMLTARSQQKEPTNG